MGACGRTGRTLWAHWAHVCAHGRTWAHFSSSPFCVDELPDKKTFKIHIESEHSEDLFKFLCSECGFNAEGPRFLKQHQDECHNIQILQNPQMKREVQEIKKDTSEDESEIDSEGDEGFLEVFVDIVKNDTRLFSKLTPHEKNTQSNKFKPFICPQCSKSYTTSSSLDRHLKNKKSHKKKITKSETLKVKLHEKNASSKNDDVKAFICSQCSKSFPRSSTLHRHVRHVHKNLDKGQVFMCSQCSKSYTAPNSLNKHCKDVHNIDLAPKRLKKKITKSVISPDQIEKPRSLKKVLAILEEKMKTNKSKKSEMNLGDKERLPKENISRKFKRKLSFDDEIRKQKSANSIDSILKEENKMNWNRILGAYKCDFCSKLFEKEKQIKNHLNLFHRCTLCEKKFGKNHQLEDHYLNKEVLNIPEICFEIWKKAKECQKKKKPKVTRLKMN